MRIAAVCFDLYGTVLTIEGMAGPVAAAGIANAPDFVRDWRRKQLEYAYISSLARAYRDFDELTALALEHTCAQRGVVLDAAGREHLSAALTTMPAFPDVADAVRAVRSHGLPCHILTNGTSASADVALRRAGLRDLFDDILSVDTVHAYKPDPRAYTIATERFACGPHEIVFVSSNGWDAWGATHFGFRVAWCNRGGVAPETLTPGPEVTLGGLHELDAFVSANLPGAKEPTGTPGV